MSVIARASPPPASITHSVPCRSSTIRLPSGETAAAMFVPSDTVTRTSRSWAWAIVGRRNSAAGARNRAVRGINARDALRRRGTDTWDMESTPFCGR